MKLDSLFWDPLSLTTLCEHGFVAIHWSSAVGTQLERIIPPPRIVSVACSSVVEDQPQQASYPSVADY